MEMEQIHDDYVSNLQVTEASRPKALMDLSLETVVAIVMSFVIDFIKLNWII